MWFFSFFVAPAQQKKRRRKKKKRRIKKEKKRKEKKGKEKKGKEKKQRTLLGMRCRSAEGAGAGPPLFSFSSSPLLFSWHMGGPTEAALSHSPVRWMRFFFSFSVGAYAVGAIRRTSSGLASSRVGRANREPAKTGQLSEQQEQGEKKVSHPGCLAGRP